MFQRLCRALLPVFIVTAGLFPIARLTSAADGGGTLQFGAAAYSVGESAGSAPITVTRTGGSAGSVSVTFNTSNGSALAGSDYSSTTQTVTFGDGDTAMKTVNVPITSDALVEGSETVSLTLSGPTGGASLGSPSTAVLTITDDDTGTPGALQFSSATYSVNEGGGAAIITVTRSGGSTGSVSVTVSTSDGSALAGSDYTATTQTVTFGDDDSASKTVSVPITQDLVDESDETVNLSLSGVTGGAFLGSPSTATLTIVDDDGPVGSAAGSVQFGAATYSVSESAGSVNVTITRSGGSTGSVSVTLSTSNGSAAAGSDYTAVTQTVTFGDSDTANKTVNIPITHDTVDEENETVNLSLSGVTGGAVIGSPSTAILTIVDDDGPQAGPPGEGPRRQEDGARPGWGCGDKNHTHTGPPGHGGDPNWPNPCKNQDDGVAAGSTGSNSGGGTGGSNGNADHGTGGPKGGHGNRGSNGSDGGGGDTGHPGKGKGRR